MAESRNKFNAALTQIIRQSMLYRATKAARAEEEMMTSHAELTVSIFNLIEIVTTTDVDVAEFSDTHASPQASAFTKKDAARLRSELKTAVGALNAISEAPDIAWARGYAEATADGIRASLICGGIDL